MKNKKGFTLVELIAIIIVIGLIIGILTPTAIRLIANSKKNAFREGMRSIVRSVEIYMEENNLRTLPEEGLFLSDEKLGLDYEDGYEGVVKYIDGEIVLENIHNGTYCGNGNLEDFNIVNYVPGECEVEKNVSKYDHCFVMGTTKVEGDTIIGYDYSNPECSKSILKIPSTVNNVPVVYFQSLFDKNDIETNNAHTLVGGYLNSDWDYWYVDIPENRKYIEEKIYSSKYNDIYYEDQFIKVNRYNYNLNMSNEDFNSFTKTCYDNNGNSYEKDINYLLNDYDNILYCIVDGDYPWIYADTSYDTFSELDFSNASNLREISINFWDSYLEGTLDMSGATSLEMITGSPFDGLAFEEVIFPASIKYIGDYAFYENYISYANFEDLENLIYIGEEAFTANMLTSINLNNSLELNYIGDYAFEDNYLTGNLDLRYLSNLEYIGKYAFYTSNYNGYNSIYLPGGIYYIGKYAFASEGDCLDTIIYVSKTNNITYNTIEDVRGNSGHYYSYWGETSNYYEYGYFICN